jgi:transposase-like protein
MKRAFRRGDPQRQSYWQGVMWRWKESGQSVRGFCRAEGLRESAFFFWRRKLEHRSGAGRMRKPRHKASRLAPATQLSDGLSSPRHSTPLFLPVRVTAPASERANAAESQRGVEIVLAQGRTIRVPQGFDRQTLAEVLAVLETRSC